jgi:hypothetical protein
MADDVMALLQIINPRSIPAFRRQTKKALFHNGLRRFMD